MPHNREDDDDRPRPGPRADKSDRPAPKKNVVKKVRADEDDERPLPKKAVPKKAPVHEDDARPAVRKRKPVLDDEDDERPVVRRRPREVEDDEEDDRPRKKLKKMKRPAKKQVGVVGVIALGIGAVALLVSLIPCFASISLIPAGIGIIVGFVGLVLVHRSEGRLGAGMPIAGMSLSFVAILIGIGWLVLGKKLEKEIDKRGQEYEAKTAREEQKRNDELAKAPAEVKNADPGAIVRVTAAQFYHAYENEEEHADRLYKNKILEVTGTLQEVNFAGEQGYVVLLWAGQDRSEVVDCIFSKDPAVRDQLAMLRPGSNITIRGKCLGDGAILEACIVVN
jgi:hypothetical protein